MGPWIVVLFSLYGVLNAQEAPGPAVDKCCEDGRERALEGQDCASLPLISSSHICRIAQEQCCAAAVGETLCGIGVTMATEQGACERPFFEGDPWETEVSKMCCDCCMLGLMAEGRGCDLAVTLGRECRHAAMTCCSRGADNATATPAFPPGVKAPATAPELETPKPIITLKPEHSITLKPEHDITMKPKHDITMEPKHDITMQPEHGITLKPEHGIIQEDDPKGIPKEDACRDSRCSQLCVGNGTCACREGYKLLSERGECEDINECLSGSHQCAPGHQCINTEGWYLCQRESSCGTGYELTASRQCHDVDECVLGTHTCGQGFVCVNTAGSFRCHHRGTCGDGYLHDAMGRCIDMNECVVLSSPCKPGETCINTVGSYSCRRHTCARGFHLRKDSTRCEDVDECALGGVCEGHGCVNLLGSYRCECPPGFTFNSVSKLCTDVDECRNTGRLCAHRCENSLGSFHCSCTLGFRLASDGRNCEDVNECESSPSPCSQECVNVFGTYQCYCRRGYQLSDIDGVTCEDIDECALPTGGHVCSYRCNNTPGSFHCTCPPEGYTLAPNARTCQDIDECASGTHSCSATESCFNVQGGFRCLSFPCPAHFHRSSEGARGDGVVNALCVKACVRGDQACALDPVHSVSHTAISLPTFRDFSDPEEVVFLKTGPAAHGSSLDLFFNITAGDEQSFDVVKRSGKDEKDEKDILMGVVRQVKPISGPKDMVLEVAMSYSKSGIISHRNLVVIHVFISEFWF